MLSIEPGGSNSGDEELRSIGVSTSVGHRELTRLGVLQRKVLVCGPSYKMKRPMIAVDMNDAPLNFSP